MLTKNRNSETTVLTKKKVVQLCLGYLNEKIWKPSLESLKMDTTVIHERPEVNFSNNNNNPYDDEDEILNNERIQVNNKKNLERSKLPTNQHYHHYRHLYHNVLDTTITNTIAETKTTMEYDCSYCSKVFYSKATLDIHLMTKRHDWRLKKAIAMMENGVGGDGTDVSGSSTRPLTAANDVIQNNEEGRYSNGSLVSSEEGYYSTDSDENKPTNNINKATKTTYCDVIPSPRDVIGGDHHQNNHHQKIHFSNSHANNVSCSAGRRRHTTIDAPLSPKRPFAACLRSKRLKREKMDELKEVYKQYAASGGSKDLYKTLLERYVDFNFYPDAEHREFNKSDTIDVSVKTNRRYSVPEKEALMRRDLVLTEMADTEKNYVDDLAFIINEYFPLMDKAEVSEDLKSNFEKIFGNIEEIYKFHSRIFMEKIDDCLEEPHLLNETFCKFEDELATLYSQYCKCKPYADEALHVHKAEIDKIRRKYLPKVKLSLKDYLVTPVQRLMKYQLLLITTKKYSDKSGAHKITLKDAIEVMDRVPKLANNAMHVELIRGYEGFLQSEDLLFQEVIEVIPGRDKKPKGKVMRVFIFDSLVIFCDIIPRKSQLASYKCIGYGQTSRMGITQTIENEPYSFAVFFRKFNTTDIYRCRADNEHTKGEWIQVLKDVIALQTIIMNRAIHHTSLDKLEHGQKKREGVCRRTSRGRYVNDLVVGETLRQALQGHPRIGEMSEKLKNNIERYILNEIIMSSDGGGGGGDGNDYVCYKPRSQSIVPISSLVDESDLKPICRPRFYSTGDVFYNKPPNKSVRPKKALVQSITSVSFGRLDSK